MDWSEHFVYDESSESCLRRKHDTYTGRNYKLLKYRAGDVAGGKDAKGYYVCKVNGKSYKAHRIIWEMFNGPAPEGFHVDHEDGVVDRNVLSNLRCVPHKINSRNQKMFVTNTSGKTGVMRANRGKAWSATWREGGRLRRKCFDMRLYGEREAFGLACEYREKMIEELNKQGAGYTERHGQEATA